MSTPLCLERLRLSADRVRELAGTAVAVNMATGPGANLGAWLEAQKVKMTGRVAVFQVEVTPALAAAWLKFNSKNRTPSRAKIRRFSRQMAAGKWMINGETVKFGASGRLLDGQSRLQAVVESGTTIVLEVRSGLPDATQESMDTGEARKHAHQLEMLGIGHPNEMAAALRLVWFWDRGIIGSAGKGRQSGDITNTTIREAMEQHPGIGASVGRCLNLKQLMPVSAAAFFHYVFAQADRKRADAFIERLTTGANLSATNPIYLLRERLTSDRMAQAKIGRREKFALIIKAWNAFRLGRPLPKLVFRVDEEFPQISGLPTPAAKEAA